MGEDDLTIQRIAGWTSTKQLKVYDLTDQDDVFKRKLMEKGLIHSESIKRPDAKLCQFCGTLLGFTEKVCSTCHHILDRDLVKSNIQKDEELREFIKGFNALRKQNPEVFEVIKNLGKEKGII